MEDLFSVNAKVTEKSVDEASQIEWKPSFKKSKDHVYKCAIRFIPNWKNPQSESEVSKYTVWMSNPTTGERREIDDPRTVGEPSVFTQTYFDLRNNGREEIANKWVSSRIRYASIIQIIDCPNKALNGQLKIWRYGDTIHKMIQEQIRPSNPMSKPKNPFNLLDGRYFYVIVTEKSGFNNFDTSAFYDSDDDGTKAQVPIQTPNGVQFVPITAANLQNEQVRNAAQEWLKGGPDLDAYKYHGMTDDDRQFATTCLNIIKSPTFNPAQSGATNAPVFGQAQGPAAAPVVDKAALGATAINAGGAPMGGMPTFNPMGAPAPMGGMPEFTNSAPAPATTPGGFGASNVPNMGDILGGAISPSTPAQPAAQAPAPDPAPGGGLSLGDVLGDIM